MNAKETFSVHAVVTILEEHKPSTCIQAIVILFSTSLNMGYFNRKRCSKHCCHKQHCTVAK